MRETFDMLPFVHAAYAIGIVSAVAMALWSWIDMRRSEKKRDKAREK